jgi:hypothetical protein
MAAVVIGKTLVAELYLPGSCKAPDRWAGICSPSSTAAAAEEQQRAADSTAVKVELWLNTSVMLERTAANAAASSGGSRGRQRRPAQAARSTTWLDVHSLLMRCIADNAARGRAVQGTSVVPPGTAAAADVELRLAQLAAAGAPVLDVRRLLLQCSAEPRNVQQQQQGSAAGWQQHAAAGGYQQVKGVIGALLNTQPARGSRVTTAAAPSSVAVSAAGMATSSGSAAAAAGTSGSNSNADGRGRRRNKQRKQAAHTAAAAAISATAGDSDKSDSQQTLQPGALAASQQLATAQQQWTAAVAAAAAVLQQALSQQPNTSSSRVDLDDDATAEAVAALVQQLATVVPQVQLIVLPIVLPGGRVGQRLPGGKGGSGSRLSAPRLLSLNVPFLVPMRHAWEQLQSLRQVLLMVGAPAPLPVVQQQQQQQQRQVDVAGLGCSSKHEKLGSCFTAGAGADAASYGQPGMEDRSITQRQQQQQEEVCAVGGMLRGVFSLQQLEQQWQQQVQLGSPTVGSNQWDQEGWFDRELQSQDHQIHHHQQQQQQQLGPPGGLADAAVVGLTVQSQTQQQQQQQQQLPGYALEAVQGMVLSCMDRQALHAPPEA